MSVPSSKAGWSALASRLLRSTSGPAAQTGARGMKRGGANCAAIVRSCFGGNLFDPVYAAWKMSLVRVDDKSPLSFDKAPGDGATAAAS